MSESTKPQVVYSVTEAHMQALADIEAGPVEMPRGRAYFLENICEMVCPGLRLRIESSLGTAGVKVTALHEFEVAYRWVDDLGFLDDEGVIRRKVWAASTEAARRQISDEDHHSHRSAIWVSLVTSERIS